MHALAPRITVSVAALAFTTACASVYDVAIETSARPTMDVSAFQRVLVPGFIAGGIDGIEADVETTRLLRSQLRSRTSLRVIDADPISLIDVAAPEPAGERSGPADDGSSSRPKDDKELGRYRHVFSQPAFWKRIGEEYQDPLIVTGTVLLRRESRNGYEQNERELFDATGRRAVSQTREWVERTVYDLHATFCFIDGRTGQIIRTDHYQQALSFTSERQIPALSAYFELMDRVVPDVLRTVSVQQVRGWRVLLK
ncbi:MAG TPA: hypothetical protein VI485_03100 [Vicinamibacterales bacterium]|nr:hypothetical protein [Vicinamibacterales bacterium]